MSFWIWHKSVLPVYLPWKPYNVLLLSVTLSDDVIRPLAWNYVMKCRSSYSCLYNHRIWVTYIFNVFLWRIISIFNSLSWKFGTNFKQLCRLVLKVWLQTGKYYAWFRNVTISNLSLHFYLCFRHHISSGLSFRLILF